MTATTDHPFWVIERGQPMGPHQSGQQLDASWTGNWVDAGDLRKGDRLLSADGTIVKVRLLSNLVTPVETVHNIFVHDLHTYYVLAGQETALVHNCAAAGGFPAVSRVVNSDIIHAAERAVTRLGYADTKAAAADLRELSMKIKRNGFPPGSTPDPKRSDSVLVPFGSGNACFGCSRLSSAKRGVWAIAKDCYWRKTKTDAWH